MPRPVRGVLVIEGVQTGDGRVIAAGALSWAELPLPLAWITDGDQHVNSDAAPQVGIVETITRNATTGEIEFTGSLDDGNDDAIELIRRMEAGQASNGNRQLLSIDPDDYEVEIILMDTPEAEGEILLLASGSGGLLDRSAVAAIAASARPSVAAAAGDPDPGPGGGEEGTTLFEDSADMVLERYTRLRIRGVTACAVSAFTEAWMELDAEEADAPPVPAEVASGARGFRPRRDAFHREEPELGDPLLIEQAGGTFAVPLTITEDREVFGHLAVWGQCHTGYAGRCVTPPDSSAAYAHFHVGEMICDDNSREAVGTLFVNCDHAALPLLAPEARDHYAHAGLAWASVRASTGQWGPWLSGVVHPRITDDQLVVLRASSPSGDWRRIGNNLELIAALSVNSPGFPIAREALAASGMTALPTVTAAAHFADGVQTALVAGAQVARCADCAERERVIRAASAGDRQVLDLLRTIEYRTRHMVPAAKDHALSLIRR